MLPKLRQYTVEFGEKIAAECSRLLAACPKNSDPDSHAEEDPIGIWIAWEWGDIWDSALMKDVVQYLYGCKDLRVPAQWKPHLPTEL